MSDQFRTVTIRGVDEAVFRQLKVLAIDDGLTIGQFLNKLIREEVATRRSEELERGPYDRV